MGGRGQCARDHKHGRNSCLKTTVRFATQGKAPCKDVAVSSPSITPEASGSEASAGARGGAFEGRRLLVVSHPAVVGVNQEVYGELARRGWRVTIVVPDRWRHEYSSDELVPQLAPGVLAELRPTRVAFRGRPQRYVHLARPAAICREVDPAVAFVEAEPFALVAAQWRGAFKRAGIPFGVQCAENIDRELPSPVRFARSRVLRDAAFVATRSESAGALARRWGAGGEVALAPHAVPNWSHVPTGGERPFTVGYAGRLVESKGLMDLLAAMRLLDAPVELLLIGDGELRSQLEGEPIPGSTVRVLDDLSHERMAEGYARFDVLALPSHTTPTWKEQFGRVIVEALWCGVPVVGSDSGEIPWLIELTKGGLVFAEGDPADLAAQLQKLREQPALRRELASTGRAAVERLFSVPGATDPFERLLVHAARADR